MAAGLGPAWPLLCPWQPGDAHPGCCYIEGKIWGLERACKWGYFLCLLAIWAVKPCSGGEMLGMDLVSGLCAGLALGQGLPLERAAE